MIKTVKRTGWRQPRLVAAAALLLWAIVAGNGFAAAPAAAEQAREIFQATGVQGGLVVHLGCGNGRLTAALQPNASYMVHGLDASAKNVGRARAYIQSRGLYGPVSVERLTGARLPYADNLVNLLVASKIGDVPPEEIQRVLAPLGVAYVKTWRGWQKTVKPWPKEIDEWSHYFHGADGNPVAHDTVVGPPRRMQWVGGPRWSRHHESMSSINACVSAGGRIFYIMDEGPAASIQLPPRWSLVARDAFNGTVLWKRPIENWNTHLWPLKSGPALLLRRLVAVGDRVYVTLGLDAPLTALDAATGRTVRTYENTAGAEEIIYHNGALFITINDKPAFRNAWKLKHTYIWDNMGDVNKDFAWDESKRALVAIQASSGKELWRQQRKVAPMTLTAAGDRALYYDGEKIVCLNKLDGEERWRSEPVKRRNPIPACSGPRLLVHEDVVVFAGGNRQMSAFAMKDGDKLWSAKHERSGHQSLEDLMVVDGLVWTGAIAGGQDDGIFKGLDPRTGEVKVEFPPDISTYWFHHRCHPSKATDNFLLTSRTGIEFVNFREKTWDANHWVRGGCVYGVMPSNGLIYAPPHPCACYLESKLNGFNALAPGPTGEIRNSKFEIRNKSDRLEMGTAYGKIVNRQSSIVNPADWPTYRGDAARSGFTPAAVPAQLEGAWAADLGGRLSGVTVAGGQVYVASIDRHTVYALDAETGGERWRFIAGGRVDSPPTIHEGSVLFGSADGWIYSLRASDGALAWRYRAAPDERKVMAFEQLESAWPVHGSVLVRAGEVYGVAGRSMFLDGGLRLVRLDAKTGRQISETVLDDTDSVDGGSLQKKVRVLNMPVALPDVLSCDGKYVYMRSQRFDLEGKRPAIPTPAPHPGEHAADQEGEGIHLFCPTGYLDDSWFHRSYWLYGRTYSAGCDWWFRAGRFVPAGRLLVYNDSSIYGYGRQSKLFCWSHALEYQLFAADRQTPGASIQRVKEANQKAEAATRRPPIFDRAANAQVPLEEISAVNFQWSRQEPPLQVRAMVLAGDTLFVAGPPDVVDEREAVERQKEKEMDAQLRAQTAALAGVQGAYLRALSAADGKTLARYKLDSAPAWDSMAAAGGRLYLSTLDGQVFCLKGK